MRNTPRLPEINLTAHLFIKEVKKTRVKGKEHKDKTVVVRLTIIFLKKIPRISISL